MIDNTPTQPDLSGDPASLSATPLKAVGKFGSRLRELRKQAEITLEWMARETGINIGSLSLIEQGRKRPPELFPHVGNIARLCGLVEGSAEHQAFVELAKKERFPTRRRRKVAAPRRQTTAMARAADRPAEGAQAAEIIRALATALDRAGGRRVLKVMLRLEDGTKVVVSLGKQGGPTNDAG